MRVKSVLQEYKMNSKKNKLLFVALIVFTFFSSSLIAAPSSDFFNSGADYFNQGDYSAAVNSFKKVEALGIKSPALYYNLASSYYKLGEYDKARTYFEKVREYENMQSLAEYNLGLTALKMNDKKTAGKWFRSVAKNSTDKKLVALAESNLKTGRARNAPKKTRWVNKKWTSYLSGRLGYDSNVNFAPLGITRGRSDNFTEVIVMADYLLSGDRKNGWLGEVFFYDINYLNENIYDEYDYGVGIKKNLQINRNWQTYYLLDVDKIIYAGDDYQTITRLATQAKNSLSKNERLYFRYGYEDIKSDKEIFDYLEGWRQKFRAEYRLYRKHDNARIYYELELNNRNDLTIPTGVNAGIYSYSPTRHTLRGRYARILSRQWQLIGDLSYRASDYPVTASQDRQDDRYRAALYVDYRFTKKLKLRAKVDYTNNRSTRDIFAYKRTVYSLGLNALF